MSTSETTELKGFDGFRGDGSAKPIHERTILRIDGGDGVGTLVDIFADGHVVFGPNCSADKTARLFWECMATFSPLHLEYEALKRKAEELKKLLVEDRVDREKAIQVLGEIASGRF